MEYRPKAALYFRISTSHKEQKTDSQVHAVEEYCRSKGYTIFKRYEDIGISGTTSSRPQLDALMDDARQNKFDVVVVYRFDRFARSTSFLLKALEEFRSLEIGFCSVSEAIDTNTPMGMAMFTIIGALSALERATIVERIKSGLRAAKGKGKILGRKKRRNDDQIISLRKQGLSIRAIGKSLQIATSSIQQALKSYHKPTLFVDKVKVT